MEAELAGLQQLPKSPPLAVASLQFKISTLMMYEGRFNEATALIEQALAPGQPDDTSSSNEATMRAILGVVAFRRGEIENCIHGVGPSSCILPISKAGVTRSRLAQGRPSNTSPLTSNGCPAACECAGC